MARSLTRKIARSPAFAEDWQRAIARDELTRIPPRRARARVDDRIARIVGPPGVRKTRLVLNMLLGDPVLAQRVRVAFSPDEDALLDVRRLLRRHPDLLLIVDDCLPLEAEKIALQFRAAGSALGSVHLLVLVPASDHGVKDLRMEKRWSVAPLDEESTLRVVAAEMG